MRAVDQTEYIVQCIRESGAMYEDDARAFLAEHDAHVSAEVLVETYPGELAMLRDLVRTIGVVVHDGTGAEKQRAEVRRLLDLYAADDAAARAEADTAPDFFRPGRIYQRAHHGQPITFVVRAVSTSPDGRATVAHGWRTDPYSGWETTDSDDITGWTEIVEGGAV